MLRLLEKDKIIFSEEILLFNLLQFVYVLLNYKFLQNLKVFLQSNYKNLNILCSKISGSDSVKHEAIILKINQVYNEIDKIPGVQAGKKRAISHFLELALDSFEDVEILPEEDDYEY